MSTTTAKPTTGPYTAEPNEENKPFFDVYKGAVKICSECGGGYARLIADSLNVYHETGLTPRQLADEMKAAFERNNKLADQLAVMTQQRNRAMELTKELADQHANQKQNIQVLFDENMVLRDQRAELLVALERCRYMAKLIIEHKPCRDVQETFAEVDYVLARAKAVPK